MSLAQRIAESGLSPEQVAERSGMEADRLMALLKGAEPTVSELRDVATALRLNISDFLPDTEKESQTALLFRQTIQNRPRKRAIKAPIENFSRKVGQSLEILREPKEPATWMQALRPIVQDYAEAERASAEFRRHFFGNNQVAPLLNLPAIAVEKLDILVFLVDNGEFEGASAFVGKHAFVFISQRTFPPRMLFTLAHELGHLVAHHGETEFVVLDVPGDVQQFRPRRRIDEAFADAFASCLLLPRMGVGLALQRIREGLRVRHDAIGDIELLYLARFFGVSFQVAAKRCEDLGLLPEGGGISLYENIVRLHRNPERYADELGLPERQTIDFPALPPRLLNDAIEGIRTGRLSIGRASSILNLSIADILKVHARAWQA